MALPEKVNNLVGELLHHLKPNNVLNKVIKCYHNKILIKGEAYSVEKNLHIYAVGKAAAYEAKALKDIIENSPLKDKLKSTVVYTKFNHGLTDEFTLQLEGDHPFISEHNLKQTKIFLESLKNLQPQDTLIFCLSGGGSALLEMPINGVSYQKLNLIFKDLLGSTLNINSINEIRKSLSQIKNGGLLKFMPTARIIQLLTCDIPNEDLADISSGPLLQKNLNTDKVNQYLEKFELSVEHLDKEIPKIDSFLTQSAKLLIKDVLVKHPEYIFDQIYDGVLDEYIEEIVMKLPELGKTIISGGELTLKLNENAGLGGRNTHFVLALADKIYQDETNQNVHIMSFATDGTDGPTDGAGAYINYDIYKGLEHVEYLENFDSYTYFQKVGTLIETGPTKNNLMDIRIIWRE